MPGDPGGRGSGGGGGRRVSRDGDAGRVVAGRGAARPATVLARPRGASSEHVDDGVLDQRREDEQQTNDHPDVDRLDVGDARQ